MHYYQFNIGDYASATAHLEPMEDLAYRRLLDLYYSNESPIADDINQVSRLLRMRSHSDVIADVLREFFALENDGWHCDRVDVEIFKYKEKSIKASDSAKARWKKDKQKQQLKIRCERIPNALDSQCDGNANQEPLTKNQEPLNTNNTATSRFDKFWDLYDKKTSRSKCEPKFNKLKESDVEKIFNVLPSYIKSTPDKKYRKDPATWLNGKCWNDEIQSTEDYSFVADEFNKAFNNCNRVPSAGMITSKMRDAYMFLINSTNLTDETVPNYFKAASTCRTLHWARDNEKYEARGIDFYLEHDTYEKIRGEI